MKTKINLERFFEDKDFLKEVQLTEPEGQELQKFELEVEYHDGLSGISGGFASVILQKFDEEDENILLGIVKSGVQSDCEDNVKTERVSFNRKTNTIKFE